MHVMLMYCIEQLAERTAIMDAATPVTTLSSPKPRGSFDFMSPDINFTAITVRSVYLTNGIGPIVVSFRNSYIAIINFSTFHSLMYQFHYRSDEQGRKRE